jgi:glycosyltransferase involved in cell wall biosynthesis
MISIAIPTYGREAVLINTIYELLTLLHDGDEILIVDQTEHHSVETQEVLDTLAQKKEIRLFKLVYPSITRAMNTALMKAKSDRVLFLDDDIVPDKELIKAHKAAGNEYSGWIVAGRVLQPWHKGQADERDKKFLFNSLDRRRINKFMAGNVSIPRARAIEVGGFDTNFVRVAYHFEAEFSDRWTQSGGKIVYEPTALIHHLRAKGGGTRSYGRHLETIRPDHAVGRYYYNLCRFGPRLSLRSSLEDLIKSIVTKHHLNNPIWIPLTLIAEIRGFLWALSLYNSGRGLMHGERPELLIIASHPVQYTSPIFKELNKSKLFNLRVFYLTIPDKDSQSLGFNHEFVWDVPLFDGYSSTCSKSISGRGLRRGYFGVRLKKPAWEVRRVLKEKRPDAVLITGWHFFGLVQIFFFLRNLNIPILLRMDSNDLKKRSLLATKFYRWYASFVSIGLSVGTRNSNFLKEIGIPNERIISCPHVVDNEYFRNESDISSERRIEIRRSAGIKEGSFCFAYIGKFEGKKNPMDILLAFDACYSKMSGGDLSLLMVGSGELEQECRRFSKEKQLPVIFTGFVNQSSICDMYAIADCVILASNEDETWGLVINEAMACGIPAIVSDRCGCATDLIEDGETGYVYTYGNIKQLTGYMETMLERKGESLEMGLKAKQLIQRHHSISLVRKGIEDAMAKLYGG